MLEERRDQKYLRRPGNRAVRRSRFRRGLLRGLAGLAVRVALLAFAFLTARQIYLTAVTSPRFEVRSIVVKGNRHARADELAAIARAARGMNIFRIDLDGLAAQVRSNPWIRSVSIRRLLPATLEIKVTERAPSVLASLDGQLFLVDAEGARLAEYGPQYAGYDFPVLNGLDGLTETVALSRLRTGAAAVAAIASARPQFARTISEIDLAVADRLGVRLADGSPLLLLSAEAPLRNLDRYSTIRNRIDGGASRHSEADPVRIAMVDLRFRGRIAVMPEATPIPTP